MIAALPRGRFEPFRQPTPDEIHSAYRSWLRRYEGWLAQLPDLSEARPH